MIDTERFLQARKEALGRVGGAGGIGTLSEKALHAALKSYYEPDFESREVKVGGFVADIVGENGIIEIQTRGFDRLGRKLDVFLEAARVTVVRATRGERIPEALLGEVICENRWDYLNLLPEDLPEPFTTKTLAKAMRRAQTQAQCAANVLYSMGVLERVGKEKNAYLYVKKQEE